MCGIIGVVAERNVTPILLEGLLRLEYRGYDSAGIGVIQNGRIALHRRAGKVRELISDLAEAPLQAATGIAHTRWATHGAPLERNAHPQVSGSRVCVVHNGIVENSDALRAELTEAGYRFSSETDTESIAHLIDGYLRAGASLLSAVRQAIRRLQGAYALAVMALDEPGRLIAARAGSPLVIGKGIGENYLSSDAQALRPVTDRFIFLEEGDLVEIEAGGISVWNLDDESVVRAAIEVQTAADDPGKGNYRHHMQKEIFEQPAVLRNTLEGRVGKDRVLEQAFGASAPEILDRVRSVTLVACGSSYYAACVARYWIEAHAGIPCQAEVASEYRYRDPVAPTRRLVRDHLAVRGDSRYAGGSAPGAGGWLPGHADPVAIPPSVPVCGNRIWR